MNKNETHTALFISIPAAGRAMGMSPRRVREAIANAQLPAIRLGARLAIPRKALERLAQVDDGPEHAGK